MKRLFVFLGFTLSIASAFGQQNFDNYEHMDNVSTMIMDSDMFRLLSKIDFSSSDHETQEYVKLITRLNTIKVYTTESMDMESMMQSDVQHYQETHELGEVLVADQDDKEVRIYAKPGRIEGNVSELLLFITAQESRPQDHQAVLVLITGAIDMSQVSNLTEHLSIPGREVLKTLK